MSKVLRPFPYSFNGVTSEMANVGDDIDFGSMAEGLAAEGYIEGEASPEPNTKQDEATPAQRGKRK